MKLKNRADIWKQQKYNNSCAWDCLSMLLNTQGVETSSRELVGSSQIPYQLRLHPEENRLSAGMLVQADWNVNLALAKCDFKLNSKRVLTIAEYTDLAQKTLLNGDAFVTSIQRPDNLPGRHAVVFTEFRDSRFLGLDPDCRLDRSVDYHYGQVKDTVDLDFELDEFSHRVAGDEGYVPLLGVLSSCDPYEPEPAILEKVFKTSNLALDFYVSATGDLDFWSAESMPIIYSIIKPVVTDLRTAIAIRDEYLNQISEIASFLRVFETEILEFRRLINKDETIPEKMRKILGASLTQSYALLEKHFAFETYRRKGALTTE
jgi:hypothetical protein